MGLQRRSLWNNEPQSWKWIWHDTNAETKQSPYSNSYIRTTKKSKVLWIYLFQITGISWYGIHSFGRRWKRRSWCRFRFCIEVLAIACCHHDHDLHGHCWNHHVGTVKIKFISTAVLWDKFECMVAKLKCSHISIYPYRSVSFKKFQGFFEPTKWKQMLPTRCFKLIPNPYFKQLWSHSIYLFKLVNSTECNLAYPSPHPHPLKVRFAILKVKK